MLEGPHKVFQKCDIKYKTILTIQVNKITLNDQKLFEKPATHAAKRKTADQLPRTIVGLSGSSTRIFLKRRLFLRCLDSTTLSM